MQRLRELRYGGEALGRRRGHRLSDGFVHVWRYGVPERPRAGCRIAEPLGHDRLEAPPDERRLARQHLVQHGRQRVLVGAAIHLLVIRLLRAHVERRADRGAGPGQPLVGVERAGDPEIGHERRAVPGEEDVPGLDVAVDHAVLVRVLQRAGGFGRDAERVLRREPALTVEPVVERFALHERHRIPQSLHAGFVRPDVARIEHGQNVGMLQPGGEADLALESLGGPAGQPGEQELEGDWTIVADVVR
jgi:hypothetical protein